MSPFNERYAQVMFRVHAEFDLNEVFFTPGQFTGVLVLDRQDGGIAYFRMYVPPGLINFDAARSIGSRIGTIVLNGKTVEVEARHVTDAGSIPRMELLGGNPDATKNVRWTSAESEEEAKRRLALKFYSFKRIDWVPFEDAWALAKTKGKLLHVVAVDGTFDDESCCGSGKVVRAGPLADAAVIQKLNDGFVNTWVLNKQLKALSGGESPTNVRDLANAVLAERAKGSPVDSLIFSKELNPIARQCASDLPPSRQEARRRYLSFLNGALGARKE